MTKIFIVTFGCSLNLSDSEYMAGLLKQAGFAIVDQISDADLVVINSCAVKQATENNFFSYLRELNNKPVVITGCIAQTMPEKLSGYSMLGTSHIDKIVDVVEETLNEHTLVVLAPEKRTLPEWKNIRKNPIVEIIPICSGCLGNCSYCIVKRARGELSSYPIEAIIRKMKSAVCDGVKEIWLTAQDTGCYGKDIGTNLPELLRQAVLCDGDYRIRLGMINPTFLKDYLVEIIAFLKSEKAFRFLHIPVQSGSDRILKCMNRRYRKDEYCEIVSKLRENIPDITISTDVICGFPGETREEYMETIELIRETKPDVLNISRYWDRPGTDSENMEGKIHSRDIKARSREMHLCFDWVGYDNSKKWLGWTGEIVIDEKGINETSIGRNRSYKQIIVPGDYSIGTRLDVKVISVTKHDLRAEIIGF